MRYKTFYIAIDDDIDYDALTPEQKVLLMKSQLNDKLTTDISEADTIDMATITALKKKITPIKVKI